MRYPTRPITGRPRKLGPLESCMSEEDPMISEPMIIPKVTRFEDRSCASVRR